MQSIDRDDRTIFAYDDDSLAHRNIIRVWNGNATTTGQLQREWLEAIFQTFANAIPIHPISVYRTFASETTQHQAAGNGTHLDR